MEEKKIESAEVNGIQNGASAEGENQERNVSHSHHGSHSHHSSHSHRGAHRSSRHKNRDNKKKKSLLDRMQSWVDKRVSRKTLIKISLWVLFAIVLFIGVVYVAETYFPDTSTVGPNQGNVDYDDPRNEISGQPVLTTTTEIPAYWESMMEKKTKKVAALQAAGGKDCVSFVWASDTHIPDNVSARTDDIGRLMAKMLDNCDIPFAVLTGDIGTRFSLDTEAELIDAQAMMPVHLAPLWGTERLLVALGNHDGCYGDLTGEYRKQFTPEKMWNTYFRGQALDSRRVFSEDGTYFYIDNQAQKTRFIVLNSQFGGEYSADSSGWATNNRFSTSCYGQEQLTWLADEALDMPEGYGAVIAAHVPPNIEYTVDKAQLIGIIDAYNHKTTYVGSYSDGVDGWSNSSLSVDFTDAKGEVIAMFAGHVHGDSVDMSTLSCPLITIMSAGAAANEWYELAGIAPERAMQTDTETSFDVVTINRKSRTIYCTRVGAGEDRTIRY